MTDYLRDLIVHTLLSLLDDEHGVTEENWTRMRELLEIVVNIDANHTDYLEKIFNSIKRHSGRVFLFFNDARILRQYITTRFVTCSPSKATAT